MSNRIYQHSPPAPKQVRFPPRSRTVRTLSSASSADRTRQSTLTQLDYVSTPSARTRQVSCSDDDGDFEEMLPTKRRKVEGSRNKVSKNHQSTLTQHVKQLQAAMRLQEVMDSDDEDLADLEDCGPVDLVSDAPKSSDATDQTRQRGYHIDISSTLNTSPRQTIASSYLEDDSTRPTTANSSRPPRTPQKASTRVVPSSVTPSSLHLSPCKSDNRAEYAQSPLKERSINLQSVKSETRRRPRPKTMKSSQILNSDPPDLAIFLDSAKAKAKDCSSPLATSEKTRRQARLPLERINTIADSEADPEEFENSTDDEECLRRYGEGDDEVGYVEGNHQHTYDPVNAALDLDAARFGSTQRFLPDRKGGHRELTEEAMGSEDEVEDLEQDPQIVRDSQTTQDVQDHCNRTGKHDIRSNENARHSDAERNSPADTPRATTDTQIQVPSSPTSRPSTVLRPSQISTVVSTQDSYATAHRFIPCSPQRSAPNSPEMAPSSPITQPPWGLPPLPPGYSASDAFNVDHESFKPQQGDSLADFSLPPLPPMSSEI